MFAFSPLVTLLCTSISVGCSELSERTIRITSLVPYYDNYNEAFSGNFSSNTTNLVKKLKNPANFGPNGVVKIQGFEFKELNLDELDISTGDEVVDKTMAETDIVYIGAVHSVLINKFEEQIMTHIQKKSVVLLLALSYEWQNFYAGDFGYAVNQQEDSSILAVYTTSDFTGPFGESSLLSIQRPLIRFAKSPTQATPILKDSLGTVRGMQEDNKLILGDGKLLFNSNVKDDSSCYSDSSAIFLCNMFGSLVEKVRDTKP